MLNRQILVVEDEDFLRSLIANYLQSAGFDVATAANAIEAARVIKEVDPDALVLDIDLGSELTGIDIAQRFKPHEKGVGLVFLTSISDDRFVDGDISKDFPRASYLNKKMLQDPSTLVAALEAVLTDDGASKFRHDRRPDRPLGQLTKMQIQVLQLLAAGKTNKQISEIRSTSLEATEAIIARIMKALELDSGVEQNSRVLAARKYLQTINFPVDGGTPK